MQKQWAFTKTYHNYINFSFRFYDIFFAYNIIQPSCFFFLEKVADAFRRPLKPLIASELSSFELAPQNVGHIILMLK